MKRPMVAANWKMYKNEDETRAFFSEFLPEIRTEWLEEVDIVFFPPALNLFVVREIVKNRGIKFGIQNLHPAAEGAFTGENSPRAARAIGADFALVGHSERRKLFAETDDVISQKVEAAVKSELTPILCVGESLEERDRGLTETIVETQLKLGLARTPKYQGVVAYEPVWAIGTGKTATPEQAEAVHATIRKQVGADTTILYGGSVKPENADELIRKPNVDGFLVGGASLKPADLTKIIQAVVNAKAQ